MKISGSYTFDGPRETIWSRIYDPASLVRLIPGCEQLEQISPDEYRGQLQLKIPAVAGTYSTYVKILERAEPRYCHLEGEVDGSAGSIRGSASFDLNPEDSRTILNYEGQALISGPLAKLDSRFIAGLVQTLIKQGLAKLNKEVQAEISSTVSTD